ncbi:D-isomer specific 2-hydroxyacid dehydrogenase family protein [Petrotoga sp. SL27]|uniref:D-isomer specific 2-hydroxyacid dehydrogenase family protein n=1 Tax=Petrotoga sp. SL27 TaxID=1445612 RepID=UPI000CDE9459|nr:D-isomer specific 2-hydroxyacid dehydrogenase family protein [Petrotoga sp. SL27]
MSEDNTNIAIVNSSTFGIYFPDLMQRLKKIGIVERITVDPQISGRELAVKLKGFKFVIASVTPNFTSEFFQYNKDVKLIARHGIGYNNVDIKAATESGVMVTKVLGIHERDSVAELAIALILICLRQIIPANKAVKENKWQDRRSFVGDEISKLTVGIIGYGNIGSRVAEIVKEGFGSKVIAYDPYIADKVIEKTGVTPVSFEELLKTSDVISLNASLNEGNYHFINKSAFDLMKNGVVIVNTARGELINQNDFIEALESKKVSAAGLDVLEEEPINPNNPLLKYPNVYILPHIGGYGKYSLRKMDEKMVEDIEKQIKGEIPEQIVNPEVIEKNITQFRGRK